MSQKESRVTILVCSCNYANMQIESINSQFCSKSLGVKFVFTHSIDHQLSETRPDTRLPQSRAGAIIEVSGAFGQEQ